MAQRESGGAPRRRGCSLRPKSGGGYVLRWRDFDGIQRQSTFTDRRQAEREQTRIRAALQAGRDPDAETDRVQGASRRAAPTLIGAPDEDAASAYIRARSRRLATRTMHRYGESLDMLRAFLEAREPGRVWTVADFSRDLLAGFYDWLIGPTGRHGRPRLPETARKHVEVASLCWRWCAAQPAYVFHCPPAAEVELPRRNRRAKPQGPTWAEYDAMLAELAKTAPAWVVRMGILARFTGERRAALLRLRWEHVDLDEARILIPDEITKGGYGGREVPISPHLLAELRGWAASPHGDGRILAAPAPELGARGHVDRTFRRAWIRAGVRRPAWAGKPIHGVRKTIRSAMIGGSVLEIIVDLFLGHVTPGTGARDYTVPAHLWRPLVEAAALIPSLPASLQGSR